MEHLSRDITPYTKESHDNQIMRTLSGLRPTERRDFVRLYSEYDDVLTDATTLGDYTGMDKSGEIVDKRMNLIASVAMNIAVWKVVRASAVLERKYGFTTPHMKLINPATESVIKDLRLTIDGISLSSILNYGTEQANKEPIGVYGNLIKRVKTESGEEKLIDDQGNRQDMYMQTGFALTLPHAIVLRLPELYPDIPPEVHQPTIELNKTLQKAISNMRIALGNIRSPHLPKLITLSDYLRVHGTPYLRNHFYKDLLNTTTPEGVLATYRKIRGYTKDTTYGAFYTELVGILEDSYDGYLGDELATTFDAPDASEKTLKQETQNLSKLRQLLFKAVPIQNGEIEVGDIDISSFLNPEDIRVSRKEGSLYVSFTVLDKERGSYLVENKISSQGFDWNLLRDPQELIPLSYEMALICKSALNSLLSKHQIRGVVQPERQKQTTHVRDEVYDLRKQKGLSEDSHPTSTTYEPGALLELDHPKIAFSEQIFSDVPENIRDAAVQAIEKYNMGLQSLTKIASFRGGRSEKGQTYYRIRHGKTRVIVQKRGKHLEVVDVGHRREIYRD